MHIGSAQLQRELQRELRPLYLVQGDELLLVNEAVEAIRAAARARGFDEREVLETDGRFDWQHLRRVSASLSLFGSARIVEIRIPGGKPGLEGSAMLQDYAAALPSDTITIVTLPKLDRQGQSAKWYKALEASSVLVTANTVTREALPRWLATRLAAQGQSADRDALDFLAGQVEGNLLAAHGELQKLALLYPSGALSFAQIREAAADLARFDVFEFGDALLAGKAGRIADILASLKAEGVDATLVLWVITRELRLLAAIAEQTRNGGSRPAALRARRVWESRSALVESAFKRLPSAFVLQQLSQAAHADRVIKGVARDDLWPLLQRLALGFCGAPTSKNAAAARLSV